MTARATNAEHRWRTLVERLPAVVYVAEFSREAPLRYISPYVERLLGFPPERFVDRPGFWDGRIHADDRARYKAAETRSYEQGIPFECEFRMLHRDGHEVHVWELDTVVQDEAGVPAYSQGVLLDVTALRRAEADVRAERDRAQQLLEVAGTVIVVLDGHGRVTLLNRAGHELLGHPDGALLGEDWFDRVIPPAGREERRAAFLALGALPPDGQDATRPETFESTVLARDGSERIVAWHRTLLRGDDGRVTATLSSGIDVTERREAEARVAHMAYHDALTGLPNRALLQHDLEQALARARRHATAVALCFFDLDDFKAVNDSLGHAAGDELLRQVADRLRGASRETDLLCRQGGDEFLLLLVDLEGDAAAAVDAAGERMLAALERPFSVAGAELHLTASIGVETSRHGEKSAEDLLRNADAAMYGAKGDGGGQVVAHRPGGRDARRRLAMQNRLRRAVTGDGVTVHWQPIVDLRTGEVHSLEALARWHDRPRGHVPASRFVRLAEESGLIDPLGDRVLEAVHAQRLAWRTAGLAPRVAVNVSARQLRRPDFASVVGASAARDGLDPSLVTVELTESVAMDDPVRGERMLRELREHGMTLAIDDFGVGYSSLARLQRLPVDVLKIDRGFLGAVPASSEAIALLRAIVDLGAAMGKTVVVEGVERPDQHETLLALGCPLAQGFLLGRPVPARRLALRPPVAA